MKRLLKRQKDFRKIYFIITELQNENLLPPKYRNHKLLGSYNDFWECHIEPDRLLIYRVEDDVLYLNRTGTHANLFE